MKKYDKLIFELSRPGRKGYQLPADKYNVDRLLSSWKLYDEVQS